MSLRLITPPTSEPILLQTAKNHLRVDISDDDDLISSLIVVARQRAEEYTRRAFITQTWEWTLPKLCPQYIAIDLRAEVQFIDSITFDNEILDASKYKLIGNGVHFDPYINGPVTIRYTSGYGDTSSNVPEQIKQAILQIIGHLYENRESQGIPPLAQDLLSLYKVWMI